MAQTAIKQARARLLGGRGPGASDQEIDQHTRSRAYIAGQPTAQRREALARRTAIARGDSNALSVTP
ncbi:MAG: hypothetical protein ACRDR6_02010 [Pseudonocardiaceae bacterium]